VEIILKYLSFVLNVDKPKYIKIYVFNKIFILI
ncbi:unnamed protein product, partial [marine sediment metagenome]